MEQGFTVEKQLPKGKILFNSNFLQSKIFHIFVFFISIILIYFNTLDAPFYLDDYRSIVENTLIRDLGKPENFWALTKFRFITYLSFGFNYYLHELSVSGYHVFNIFIHFLSTVAAYFLSTGILKTKQLDAYLSDNQKLFIPFLTALLFAVHPLQTQAVTYIVQRATSLAAFFYLGTVAFYIFARIRYKNRQMLFFPLSFIFCVCAFMTKQNTFTLPIIIFISEIIFFNYARNHPQKVFIPLAIGSFLIISALSLNNDLFTYISNATAETDTISRVDYFLAQLQVIWIYIAKFIIPINLHLDYIITPAESYFNIFIFGLGHLLLISAAFYFAKRSPVISFSLFFYFISHLVESSFIPIRDLVFEHRTYLPNFGLCLITVWIFTVILPRRIPLKLITFLFPVLLLTFSILTWSRNEQWRDPISFYEHEISINPTNLRVRSLQAEVYIQRGDFDGAMRTYQQAVELVPDFFDIGNNTLIAFFLNFIISLDESGNSLQALEYFNILDINELEKSMKSRFLTVRGNIKIKLQRFDEAEPDLLDAISLDNNNVVSKVSYGILLGITNREVESLALFVEINAQYPDDEDAIKALEFYRNNPPNSP